MFLSREDDWLSQLITKAKAEQFNDVFILTFIYELYKQANT